MYDQIRQDTLFIILFAVVTAMAAMECCYLLFRRGNAFAPHITTPARLRRWTAAFFAAFALCHLWYMPIFFLSSSEDIMMIDLIGGLLDSQARSHLFRGKEGVFNVIPRRLVLQSRSL